ncbi:MAG: hypothetical protein HRT47_07250 [Candidatus Caenarcaniphilales bacterium]|nr:hypothetical protein [Candidatus Caenarcaniphilales bacterium]
MNQAVNTNTTPKNLYELARKTSESFIKKEAKRANQVLDLPVKVPNLEARQIAQQVLGQEKDKSFSLPVVDKIIDTREKVLNTEAKVLNKIIDSRFTPLPLLDIAVARRDAEDNRSEIIDQVINPPEDNSQRSQLSLLSAPPPPQDLLEVFGEVADDFGKIKTQVKEDISGLEGNGVNVPKYVKQAAKLIPGEAN